MLSTNYLFNTNINFTGKNRLISPTNTNLQTAIGEENLTLLNKIRLVGKANGQDTYLVGGAVRDCLLGKIPNDLDIMINGDALKFPQKLMEYDKKTFNGTHLKKIVKRSVVYTDKKMNIDIVPLCENGEKIAGARNIKNALYKNAYHRDYTVNSMFIHLGEDANGNIKLNFIDFMKGKKDLKNNTLIHATKKCTSPVEAMRGLRLKLTHNMKLASETNDIIKTCINTPENKANINYIRLAKEFYKIFKSDNSLTTTLKMLRKYKTFKLWV